MSLATFDDISLGSQGFEFVSSQPLVDAGIDFASTGNLIVANTSSGFLSGADNGTNVLLTQATLTIDEDGQAFNLSQLDVGYETGSGTTALITGYSDDGTVVTGTDSVNLNPGGSFVFQTANLSGLGFNDVTSVTISTSGGYFATDNVNTSSVSAVPEPASLWLMAAAVVFAAGKKLFHPKAKPHTHAAVPTVSA